MAIRKRTALKEPEILPEQDQPNCGQLSLSPSWFVKDPGKAKAKYQEFYDVFLEALTKSWINQVGGCANCDKDFDRYGLPKDQPVLKHIIELDDGGNSRLSNLKFVCGDCSKE